MFKKILFIKIILFSFLSSNLYSFEKDAEQLVQSTTDNAKEIILNKEIKNKEKKNKNRENSIECSRCGWFRSFFIRFSQKKSEWDTVKGVYYVI